jgi:hypothetical protein
MKQHEAMNDWVQLVHGILSKKAVKGAPLQLYANDEPLSAKVE